MKDDERLETAADRLDKAMDVVEAPVRKISAEAKRLKFLVRVLLVVVVAQGLGLLGLGWVALIAQDAADRASAALIASCESGNDYRRLDLERWLYILDLTKDAPLIGTPAEQKAALERRVRFEAYVRAADKLRDCSISLTPTISPTPVLTDD